MISKYDILKLQEINIEDVAAKLNINVKRHAAICFGHCDTHASLMFNIRKNRFRCYVCDKTYGNTIDLVMQSQGWNFYESCQWLSRQFGIALTDDRDYKAKPLKVFTNNSRTILDNSRSEEKPDVAYLERLMCQPVLNEAAQKFLFEERKLSREVIRQLGISSISYNCPMSSSPRPSYFDGPALLFPYRDIDGNLMSVQSRYLGTLKPGTLEPSVSRFRFPKGSTCHIFNLPLLKNLPKGSDLYLAEGVSDCLAYLSSGLNAVAIPSSTLLKEEDTKLLNGFTLRICPDSDIPGERLFLQLRKFFPKIIRHQLPAGCKDFAEAYVKMLNC